MKFRTIVFASLMTVMIFFDVAFCQVVRQEWVARYDATGNLSDNWPVLTLDSQGNVYITGTSGEALGSGTSRDYATAKYDTNGNQLWAARYNGPGNGADNANAIAVDSSGNVYVTGGSVGSGTTYDYATVKYDTNGNQMWVARYHGPGNNADHAHAIAVDSSGNVYVTGDSVGSGTSYDYATIKYDTNGNQLWVARYHGPGNADDSADAIVVDDSGNVYVTGQSKGSGTSYDYATVKYDSNGVQLWVARYNGPPGDSSDQGHDITIDSAGNVYVTGKSWGSGTDIDYATIKYDSSGSELWVARYNGTSDNTDIAEAIVVDINGNVFVTGRSGGTDAVPDVVTIKYDSNGNTLWTARKNGTGYSAEWGRDITLDIAGNVYVVGSISSVSTGDDSLAIKYDSNGNELWASVYKGTANKGESAYAVALDGSGSVYVAAGANNIGTDYDYAVIKYDTSGNELWASLYSGTGSLADSGRAITVDDVGNVYVTGMSGSLNNADYATIKYDIDGNVLWSRRYNGSGNQRDEPFAVLLDGAGNVYVAGRSQGAGESIEYATVKYDTGGNELWVARYDSLIEFSGNQPVSMALDGVGNVYITGLARTPIVGDGTSDYATIKYDTNGNQMWVASYRATGHDQSYAIAVDSLGNAYVTGLSEGSGTGYDYATVKYDSNGNELWVTRYDGTGSSNDFPYDIVVDDDGNVYVTGQSMGLGTNDDYVTVKYDSNGNELWVNRYNGTGNYDDSARAIAVESSGNIYVTGWAQYTDSGADYTTIKYDTNGNQLWVARYSQTASSDDKAYDLTFDSHGNVYVTGISFYDSYLSKDYATVKYGPEGNQLWEVIYHNTVPVSPYHLLKDNAYAISVDTSENVYVTGESVGFGTDFDFATIKYSQGSKAMPWIPLLLLDD